jgi:hypothetical protein
MQPTDKRAFKDALDLAFETIGKPLPSTGVLTVFWASLEVYPLEAVLHAISQHVKASEFAPTPAAILKHLPKQRDGHVEGNEAWAIALRSRDERDTVVWTREMAEAFSLATSILEGGDEVGARMAFLERYRTLMEDARANGRPARWYASLGHDGEKREAALAQAVQAGLLQLEQVRSVAPQLCAPDAEVSSSVREAQMAKLREVVGGVKSSLERKSQEQTTAALLDREQTEQAKRAAAQRVAEYEARQ